MAELDSRAQKLEQLRTDSGDYPNAAKAAADIKEMEAARLVVIDVEDQFTVDRVVLALMFAPTSLSFHDRAVRLLDALQL